ncbi:hypothetical protein [Confluentibacter flavum]|uniref:Uncharacterized protein n=1 Tax=Confluentibacter flavum TaxID=1909700 RepID=A0A2N3HIW8_9FLAO|nr:hypothetical protein [Confluentibacter flavum]PKQ44915.1 hypothetical protein CSW08_10920 [Confluentibacter flavum]
MKSTLFTRILTCIILSVSFFSCETEDLNSKSNEAFKTADLTIDTAETTLLDYIDCESVCIEAGSGTYYKINDSKTGSNGPHTKQVSYEAYNTETQFIVNVFYDIIAGTSNAKADITITIDGNDLLFEDVAKGSTVTRYFDLPEGWVACNVISFDIVQEALGNPIEFSELEYALVGVCPEGCEESFSYQENEDNSYTFTYISPEDLNAAEVKLTCPHIISFESLDGKNYDVNSGNGKGSPTVLTWTGDIEACTEITFTLAFEADCEQNSGGFANIFTDFKVNDISKKGDSTNIKFECPSE